MQKSGNGDASNAGKANQSGDGKQRRDIRARTDNPELGQGSTVPTGGDVEHCTESVEGSGTETIPEGGELSPKQKDPLEHRSVSLRRSQWEWLDKLTVDHAMKSASVFLREWIDKIRKEDNEQD